MKTYYVVFHPNGRVDVEENKNFDQEVYEYVKTRTTEDSVLEYYAHKSRVDFYKTIFNVSV